MVLLFGDLRKKALKKSNAVPLTLNDVFVAKKEHVFCEPCLIVHINSKIVMQVKRLKLKFRGNNAILFYGLEVEVCWDVYN
ncbi:hypothetical protein MtrunA17_Chr8g0368081 [Medicago truncatula]|uniref:Uncharacterized protein n=1 Tax=Medicago truncatula TaxID=3880 RepID=A0A396GMJ8_MEDTR|nr:hypothetical protein MtrunA17_Chr8g0368081 [Medicago truncatula]